MIAQTLILLSRSHFFVFEGNTCIFFVVRQWLHKPKMQGNGSLILLQRWISNQITNWIILQLKDVKCRHSFWNKIVIADFSDFLFLFAQILEPKGKHNLHLKITEISFFFSYVWAQFDYLSLWFFLYFMHQMHRFK